jgi:hypothetical protein
VNRYTYCQGFKSHEHAQAYADSLPDEARAKVVPYRDRQVSAWGSPFDTVRDLYSVDVCRNYVETR